MSMFVKKVLWLTLWLLVLDVLWIAVIAKPWYREWLGPIMAPEVNKGYAVGAYLCMLIGLSALVLYSTDSIISGMIKGAFFGLAGYGTYDFTNAAVLNFWSVRFLVVDITWGIFVCALSVVLALLCSRS